MTILDILLAPFFLIIIYLFSKVYVNALPSKLGLKSYFFPGLLMKFVGTLAFAIVYQFYYGNGKLVGDTSLYWRLGWTTQSYFWNHPLEVIQYLYLGIGEMPAFFFDSYVLYSRLDNQEYSMMASLTMPLSIITFQTYLNAAFLFGLFAYIGQWNIFLIFAKKYPLITKELAYVCLFIPSIAFWGGGIMKDTVAVGAVGMIVYYANNLFNERKNILSSIFWLLFYSIMLLNLKAYILIALLVSLFIWVVFGYSAKIKQVALRYLLLLGLSTFSIPLGAYFLKELADTTERFKLENLESMAKGFQSTHESMQRNGSVGSGYTLHMDDFSVGSLAKVFPQAINVALFRPYFWEAGSPVMLLSALESFILMIGTIFVLLKGGFWAKLRYIRDPDVLMALSFSLILAFACGITAFNFGALVRFRIPLLPFYGIALLILYSKIKLLRLNLKEQKR
jgi:hypothetical protein